LGAWLPKGTGEGNKDQVVTTWEKFYERWSKLSDPGLLRY